MAISERQPDARDADPLELLWAARRGERIERPARALLDEAASSFRQQGEAFAAASPAKMYRAAQAALWRDDLPQALELFAQLATDPAVIIASEALHLVLAWLGATSCLSDEARKGQRLMRHARETLEEIAPKRARLLTQLEAIATLGAVSASDEDTKRDFIAARLRELVFVRGERLPLDQQDLQEAIAAEVLERLAMARGVLLTQRAPEPDGRTLRLSASGAEATLPDGARLDLKRRRAPRLIFNALCEARRQSPGACLSVGAIFAVGWPDQPDLHPEKAAARVYFAINTLRELGLRDDLQRTDRGYRLSPTLVILESGATRWLTDAISMRCATLSTGPPRRPPGSPPTTP